MVFFKHICTQEIVFIHLYLKQLSHWCWFALWIIWMVLRSTKSSNFSAFILKKSGSVDSLWVVLLTILNALFLEVWSIKKWAEGEAVQPLGLLACAEEMFWVSILRRSSRSSCSLRYISRHDSYSWGDSRLKSRWQWRIHSSSESSVNHWNEREDGH